MYSNRIRKIRKTGQYFSDLNGKIRDDLKIYKAKELESALNEINDKNKKNCTVGCIYKHPKMLTYKLNDMLNPILKKTSSKQRICNGGLQH